MQSGSHLANRAEDFASSVGQGVSSGLDSIADTASNAFGTMDVAGGDNGLRALNNTYVLDETNQWGWITLYVVTIVIAILGNLLFVVASLCTKRTRTTGQET